MKVTISFSDDDLYRQVKVQAAVSGRQVREIVEEALQQWLDRAEEAEDRDAAARALEEYEVLGGVNADTFFDRMVSEGRIEYGTD